MNFKESYKKANDEIEGDKALLDKILSTPVKEKSKITPIVYKTASLAAAFLLIITIALMPEITEKFSVNEASVSETEAEDIEEAVSEESIGVLADSEEADDGAVTFSVKRAEDLNETESTSVNMKTKETAPETVPSYNVAVVNGVNDEIAAYSGEAEATEVKEADETAYDSSKNGIALAAETQTISEEAEEVQSAEVRASGGGSSFAVMKSAGPKAKYAAGAVLAGIGISYESLEISGMMLTEDNVSAEYSEDGTISSYDIEITLSDEERVVTVLLTDSVTPLAFSVTEDGGVISASKTLNNTDIFITAYNMTKEEIENYINAIA